MARELDGREYKILVDPETVGDPKRFAKRALRPILGERVADGATFEKDTERTVWFLDTDAGTLDDAGLSLRRRSKRDETKSTLKLRLSDRFVAAGADLTARQSPKDKFEEDIAPLEVPAGGGVAIARPPDLRSRFALSIDTAERDDPATLGDAFAMFPGLGQVLLDARVPVDPAAPLRHGPEVAERVLEDLPLAGEDMEAKLDLTLWDLPAAAEVRRVVEVSFRCKLRNSDMPGPAARAALRLFLDLQSGLTVERRFASKTRLALPPRR